MKSLKSILQEVSKTVKEDNVQERIDLNKNIQVERGDYIVFVKEPNIGHKIQRAVMSSGETWHFSNGDKFKVISVTPYAFVPSDKKPFPAGYEVLINNYKKNDLNTKESYFIQDDFIRDFINKGIIEIK